MIRFLFLMLLLAVPAFAAEKAPISIEAGDQLEWLRNENKYRATRDVVITQGDTIIKGDTVEALYDPAQGPSALTFLTIDGNVSITQDGRTITADKANYDTIKQELLFTGDKIVITTPDLSVQSNGQVQYLMAERKAVSNGATTIKQKDQVLKADHVTAIFDDKNTLTRAMGRGNVIITRQSGGAEDVVRAENADYNTGTGKIVLTGNVRLARGENFMQGERAIIDLKTGYSSLQNNAAQGGMGRVRAIFSTASGGSPVPKEKLIVPIVPVKKKPEAAYQVSP
jgi:lipopolysaccharide export system protein LptA